MKLLGLLVLVLGMGTNAWARCEESYVPDQDWDALMEIREWGAGSAFGSFAEKAGFKWDQAAYVRDAPVDAQMILAYSARTGISCVKIDVVAGYISYMDVLFKFYAKTKNADDDYEGETFTEFYLRLLEGTGMDKYLSYDNDWA